MAFHGKMINMLQPTYKVTTPAGAGYVVYHTTDESHTIGTASLRITSCIAAATGRVGCPDNLIATTCKDGTDVRMRVASASKSTPSRYRSCGHIGTSSKGGRGLPWMDTASERLKERIWRCRSALVMSVCNKGTSAREPRMTEVDLTRRETDQGFFNIDLVWIQGRPKI